MPRVSRTKRNRSASLSKSSGSRFIHSVPSPELVPATFSDGHSLSTVTDSTCKFNSFQNKLMF